MEIKTNKRSLFHNRKSSKLIRINPMDLHKCRLVNPPIPPIAIMVDSGICINLRRKLVKYLSISRKHPYTSRVFRSNLELEFEEIRLLSKLTYVVHPFSMFSLHWELLMGVSYLFYYVIIMILAFRRDEMTDVQIGGFFPILMTLILIFMIDIIVSFFKGYYHMGTGKTVLKLKHIAKNYLTHSFLLDFIPCFTLLTLTTNSPYISYARLLPYLRFLRAPRVAAAMDLYCLYKNYGNFSAKLMNFIMLSCLLLLSLFTLLFFLRSNLNLAEETDVGIPNASKWTRAIFIFEMIFLIQSGWIFFDQAGIERSVSEKYFDMCIMVVGFVFRLFLFVYIYRLWLEFHSEEHEEVELQFSQYLRYKGLPPNAREKFCKFYQYKYFDKYFNEIRINKLLSKLLKQEVLLSTTRNFINQVDYFKIVPDNVVAQLVSRMRTEIFLPNDTIIKSGVKGSAMFFIRLGTITFISERGEELFHLNDDAYFGVNSLILDTYRTTTVKAVTSCELYKLTKSDFFEVLAPHPDLKNQIIKAAQTDLSHHLM